MSVDAYGKGEIKIYPDSQISSGKTVRLGDISHISGIDYRTVNDLNRVVIAQFKKNQKEIKLSAREVSKRLRSYLIEAEAKLKARIRTRIPNSVKMKLISDKVSEAGIIQKMNRRLKQICNECVFEVQLKGFQVPKGKLESWDVALNQVPKGGFSVPLNLAMLNERPKTIWLTGTVKSYKYYPVSQRLLKRGHVLTENDFNFQMREATYDRDGILRKEDLIGKEVGKALVAGERIRSHLLNSPILVKYGQTVKVQSGNSILKVFVDGVVQQDARKGQTVRIKIPRTKKVVSAEVLDRSTVRIR